MAGASEQLRLELEAVSRALQAAHKRLLEAEGSYLPGQGGPALLDHHIDDPSRVWLLALSTLIADLDEALANEPAITLGEASAAAEHVRAMVQLERRSDRAPVAGLGFLDCCVPV